MDIFIHLQETTSVEERSVEEPKVEESVEEVGWFRKLIGCMGLLYLPSMNGWFFGLGNYTSPMDPLGYWFDPVWNRPTTGWCNLLETTSWWVQKSDQVEMSLVISLGMQHCIHSGWLAGYLPSRVWKGLFVAGLLKFFFRSSNEVTP